MAKARIAASVYCGIDDWADYNSWTDNYYVGGACDQRGEYVRGIQIISNETYPYTACPAGAVDGYWGPNTRSAVVCWQSQWGLPQDGVVGSYTWTIYRSQISYTDTYGDYKSYRTDWGYDRFFKNTTNKRWYLNRDCSSAKEEFHRQGPDFSNCDD